MAFIETNRRELKRRHYIQNATTHTHWYNFHEGTMSEYVQEYGNEFCLVINCSTTSNHAYVLPFAIFEHMYSPDYLQPDKRWNGTVIADVLSVSLRGKPTKTAPVRKFLNAFQLIQPPPPSEFV